MGRVDQKGWGRVGEKERRREGKWGKERAKGKVGERERERESECRRRERESVGGEKKTAERERE